MGDHEHEHGTGDLQESRFTVRCAAAALFHGDADVCIILLSDEGLLKTKLASSWGPEWATRLQERGTTRKTPLFFLARSHARTRAHKTQRYTLLQNFSDPYKWQSFFVL
jgi:hypothetical protein